MSRNLAFDDRGINIEQERTPILIHFRSVFPNCAGEVHELLDSVNKSRKIKNGVPERIDMRVSLQHS